MSEKIVAIVPLNYFDSNVESLELGDRLTLRRAGVGEIQKLKESFPTARAVLGLALRNVTYVLEIELKPDYSLHWDEKSSEVQSTILALRLLKLGDANVSCSFILEDNIIYQCSLPPTSEPRLVNPYFLKKEEVEELKVIWNKLQNITSESYLHFPLERFMESYEETTPEDKIVESMVAFESVVFHNVGDIGRKGIPLAIAVSMFLGNKREERDTIRENIRQAYDVRNARVHGLLDKLEKYRKQNNGELALKAYDYLRRALRKLVEE